MSNNGNDEISAQVYDDKDTKPSRRRPGRRADVHASLIPIQRGAATLDVPLDAPADVSRDVPMPPATWGEVGDPLAAIRGIVNALLLAVPFWLAIGIGAYFLLR